MAAKKPTMRLPLRSNIKLSEVPQRPWFWGFLTLLIIATICFGQTILAIERRVSSAAGVPDRSALQAIHKSRVWNLTHVTPWMPGFYRVPFPKRSDNESFAPDPTGEHGDHYFVAGKVTLQDFWEHSYRWCANHYCHKGKVMERICDLPTRVFHTMGNSQNELKGARGKLSMAKNREREWCCPVQEQNLTAIRTHCMSVGKRTVLFTAVVMAIFLATTLLGFIMASPRNTSRQCPREPAFEPGEWRCGVTHYPGQVVDLHNGVLSFTDHSSYKDRRLGKITE